MISSRRAASILFLEGLASSGVQMVTLRQTVPFVGSSILCTSIIISCFLGALALGYWCGGKTSPERFSQSLLRNLVIAIALFGTTTATNVQQPRFIAFADLHNEGGLNAHKFEIAHVSKIYEIGTSTSQVNTTTLKRDCHNTSYYGFSLNRMYCIIQFVYCLLCALTLTLVRQQCQRY
jgi:hypothetical protein